MNIGNSTNSSPMLAINRASGKPVDSRVRDLGALLQAAYDAGLITARDAGYRQGYEAGFAAGRKQVYESGLGNQKLGRVAANISNRSGDRR